MTKLLLRYIPDEWISAARAFQQMVVLAFRTKNAIAKCLIGLVVPFAIASSVRWVFWTQLSVDFVQGFLAVAGVVFGFVVTLMLFTGNLDGTDILSHEQAKLYARKIYYLLFSQALTLGSLFLSIVLAAWWLFLFKGNANAGPALHVVPFVYGSMGLAFVRTILLPAQIYERHHFVMEALVEKKRLEEMKELERRESELAAFRHRHK